MKTHIKSIFIFLMVGIIVNTTACRTELDEEIGSPQDQTLRENSKVADLILKTALNDGSGDNILDSSSCFNVELPVTVNVNGIEVIVDSVNDFERIEEIFNQLEDDLDDLSFIFPITLIASDFSETIIENTDQLEELLEDCEEQDEDDDIECIDFQYPFSVSVFNENSETLEIITFNNDKELYSFINNLTEDDIVNISFPITLILSDDTEVVINNLDDLENVIEDAIDDCDENDLSDQRFIKVITSQSLKIQKYKDNQSNETNNYRDYVFNFSEDGTVVITLEDNDADDSNNEITNGTWSVHTRVNGGLDATLDFGTEAPLNKLNNQWNVKKIKENRIMLDDRDGIGANRDELFFDKI
ncbi:hypothetical protein [Aquimarina sp. 2201CG14-23]|uniref:hypothetical protein n=1 Tax=Aquimarina mycalae TaxID=3040073 RepID=UPI002477CF73|nr:hypothetical protein [Aquimarina sp. 2201CG14-23]MDH7444400.1 hypothetical protein [Aquimarina sp. 2201CG14-23]